MATKTLSVSASIPKNVVTSPIAVIGGTVGSSIASRTPVAIGGTPASLGSGTTVAAPVLSVGTSTRSIGSIPAVASTTTVPTAVRESLAESAGTTTSTASTTTPTTDTPIYKEWWFIAIAVFAVLGAGYYFLIKK